MIKSDPYPREIAPREAVSREPSETVPQRRPGRHRRAPVQFMFNKQNVYTMVKLIYSRMIWNLQFSGEYQDLQYIHTFIMDP